jgi:hypothetical protein
LFATNVVFYRANTQLINNARKPRSKKRLVITVKWLTKVNTKELRNKQVTKENTEKERKIITVNKKADTVIRKAQKTLNKVKRQEQAQATRELKAEFERLRKIQKSLFKK